MLRTLTCQCVFLGVIVGWCNLDHFYLAPRFFLWETQHIRNDEKWKLVNVIKITSNMPIFFIRFKSKSPSRSFTDFVGIGALVFNCMELDWPNNCEISLSPNLQKFTQENHWLQIGRSIFFPTPVCWFPPFKVQGNMRFQACGFRTVRAYRAYMCSLSSFDR